MTGRLIVVGTDGSAEALRAVEWAAREAVLRSADLRIVSAAEMLPRMTVSAQAGGIETVATHLSQQRDLALAAAASAAAATAPELPAETVPLDGPPAQAVTGSGSGALMLVVGSKGSSAFAAMTLGSVSRYAAVSAPCPVVVVREQATSAGRLVAVGVRGLEDCAAALAFAFEEAQLRKASLLAVHALQSRDSHAAEQATRELNGLLDGWRSKYPDVGASQHVVHGHPGRVLADQSVNADLVVLGRRGRKVPGPARVIHAVMSHAHGPVVTVPPKIA